MTATHPCTDILELLPEGVIISDAKTKVRYANAAARKLMRLSKRAIAHTALVDRVHPADKQNVKQYARKLRTEKHMVTKRWFRRGDGTYIFLERNTVLLRDGTQLSLCRDVTAGAEEYVKLERFMSIASHELRNPLSSIQLNAELLAASLDKAGDPQKLAYLLEGIREQVHAQNRMISDFLDVTRITKGKLSFNLRRVEMLPLLKKVVSHVSALNGRVCVLHAKSGCAVWGDHDRLYQVFFNLLQNACKYSAPPSKIKVACKAKDDLCTIAVKDNGIGIKHSDRQRIFEDFFQSNEKKSEGLGIGLFLASVIIRSHHGSMSVKSSPGKGSTFTVTLPLARTRAKK